MKVLSESEMICCKSVICYFTLVVCRQTVRYLSCGVVPHTHTLHSSQSIYYVLCYTTAVCRTRRSNVSCDFSLHNSFDQCGLRRLQCFVSSNPSSDWASSRYNEICCWCCCCYYDACASRNLTVFR